MDVDFASGKVVRPFGAREAIGIFLIFMAAMVLGSYSVSVFVAPYFTNGNLVNDQDAIDGSVGAVLILQQLASLLLASFLTMYLLKFYFPGKTRAQILAEVGFIKRSNRSYVGAALIGLLITLFFTRYLMLIFPPPDDAIPSQLLYETQTGDWIQYLTIFTLVFIGPIAEEFLYRGIMYRGLSKSFGISLAGIFVTLVFVILHNETLSSGYRLAIVLLVLNSVLLLITRVFSGSIVPPIFMHMGMNMAILLPK